MYCGLPPKGDFAAIDPKDPWVSSRARPTRYDRGSRDESQLHETKGDIVGELQGFNYARLPLPEIGKGQGSIAFSPAVAPPPSESAPTPPSEQSSGSHQIEYLVENHFHPLTISE